MPASYRPKAKAMPRSRIADSDFSARKTSRAQAMKNVKDAMPKKARPKSR